jgi:LTXXQ motif family protein
MHKVHTLKLTARVGAIGVLCCVAAAAGFAQPGKHPAGGRPGGAPHFAPHVNVARPAGGMAHFARPSGGVTHFARPHISHFATPHVSHLATPHISHLAKPSFRTGHPQLGSTHGTTPAINHPNINARTNTALHTPVTPSFRKTGPRNFARHRHFAANAAFRPFLHNGWHPHHHLGWVGPLFWPYAYGDFFYASLWPDEYEDADPFWAYGYDDIYEGIFSPYSYDEYVQGPRAPARMSALTQNLAQSCTDEAAEVTGWPIDQIQDAIQPNAQQSKLLDNLGNAIVKASDVITSHCPTTVSFTPTGRLAEMQRRLEGMVQAVNIVSPALTKFYNSLSDEQKARFNDIGTKASHQNKSTTNTSNSQAQCGENIMAWPTDQIDRTVQPTNAQLTKLQALQSAAAQAADTIKAACPSAAPGTPPSRLEAAGKRLQAMLQAVKTVKPALTDFYNALSDDQKARFNTLGQQLSAQSKE